MKHENVGKKEQALLSANKLAVPLADIKPYLSFLDNQRTGNREELTKAEKELNDMKEMMVECQGKYSVLFSKQTELDDAYQRILAFSQNPDGGTLMFYSHQQRGVIESGLSGQRNGSTTVISPQEHKKERNKSISWIDEAVELLKKENKFLTCEEIVNTIFKNNPSLKAQALERYKGLGTSITLIGISFEDHATNILTRRQPEKQKIVLVDGKYGLVNWIDLQSLKPKEYFASSFPPGITVTIENSRRRTPAHA